MEEGRREGERMETKKKGRGRQDDVHDESIWREEGHDGMKQKSKTDEA